MGTNTSGGTAQDRQEKQLWVRNIESENIAGEWTGTGTETEIALSWNTRPTPAKLQRARDEPFFESSRDNEIVLPELEGQFFHFGGDADQEFVIYTRICLPKDATKALVPWLYSESSSAVAVGLKYHGKEFIQRRLLFRRTHSFNFTLDVKFSVRCNRTEFPALITHLSCTISLLVAPIFSSAADEKVLESDEIFYGSLAHTTACLSVCKFSAAQWNPLLLTYASCYIFLDRPSAHGSPGSFGKVWSDCSNGSHLMTVFKEIKNSAGTIDLTRPSAMAVGPTEIVSVDNSNLEDDD